MTRPSDRRLLLGGSFLRALAIGALGIDLGILLDDLAYGELAIGFVIGAGLVGNAGFALLATLFADRLGRRRALAATGVLGAAGGLVVAFAMHPLLVGVGALVGMVNGMGRDRGAASVLEQAILPLLVPHRARTREFAWYFVLGDVGHALGAGLAALPVLLRALDVAPLTSLRAVIAVTSLLLIATTPLALALSPAVEVPRVRDEKLSPASRSFLGRISALFAVDAVGGGFLTTAWLAHFFHDNFDANELEIGLLFLGARVLNAVSHLVAARLARRIGLLRTMVVTHAPSSVLLLTVLWAPSFLVAAVLFLLREGLSQMDVPTRQSYCMGRVARHEHTVVAGTTQLVRLGGWAVAPFAAGALATVAEGAPFFAGAALQLVYDGLLWASFRAAPPPEEVRPAAPRAPAPGRSAQPA